MLSHVTMWLHATGGTKRSNAPVGGTALPRGATIISSAMGQHGNTGNVMRSKDGLAAMAHPALASCIDGSSPCSSIADGPIAITGHA